LESPGPTEKETAHEDEEETVHTATEIVVRRSKTEQRSANRKQPEDPENYSHPEIQLPDIAIGAGGAPLEGVAGLDIGLAAIATGNTRADLGATVVANGPMAGLAHGHGIHVAMEVAAHGRRFARD
jgi:hypothetical protein